MVAMQSTATQTNSTAGHRGGPAVLYLDGKPVGTVDVKGWAASWGYGYFRPNNEFASYAPMFGLWSLLMHADTGERLSDAAAKELSSAETALDMLRARLLFTESSEWVHVAQLTIDGDLLEWKEY
jgi:hypothetical protein